MGFLDRIASLVRRSESVSDDPKGPLGLMPGDEISYYRERFRVVGIRTLVEQGAPLFHYRLLTVEGDVAVLSAESMDVETWKMERATVALEIDWDADAQTGPEGDAFALLSSGSCAVQHYGNTGFESAQRVTYRRFADEDEEQMIVLEDYGVGREVRVADPIFEGELHFEAEVTAAEDRPWAVADDENDAAAEVEDDTSVSRGSTVAAALALEGRFVSDDLAAEAFANTDPFEYVDEEWSDARDAVPEPQALPGSADAPNDPRAEWLTPTRWVDGSGEPPPVDVDDDWLVKTA